MHGDENTVGSYTLGGTESIMLAVRSAREWFRKKEGKSIKYNPGNSSSSNDSSGILQSC